MSDIVFTVRLNKSDWNREKGAWNCPALDIPGSRIQSIFKNGARTDPAFYQILYGPAMIRWIKDDIPALVSVEILVPEASPSDDNSSSTENPATIAERSAQDKADRWRNFGIIVPIITAIIAAIATYASSRPRPPSDIHFKINPNDITRDRAFAAPTLTINGQSFALPSDYRVTGETTAVIDFGGLMASVNASANEASPRSEQIEKLRTEISEGDEKAVALIDTLSKARGLALAAMSNVSDVHTCSAHGAQAATLLDDALKTVTDIRLTLR